MVQISIHTFLAEGDRQGAIEDELTYAISIHTFLAEGDVNPLYNYRGMLISIHTFLAEGDETEES